MLTLILYFLYVGRVHNGKRKKNSNEDELLTGDEKEAILRRDHATGIGSANETIEDPAESQALAKIMGMMIVLSLGYVIGAMLL